MKRIRSTFSPRRRRFFHDGLEVPPGMLAIAKAARPERAANRRAREKAAAALERDLADVLSQFREGISLADAEAAVVAGNARVIVNAAAPNELEAQLVAVIGEALEGALKSGAEIGLRFSPGELSGVPVSIVTETALSVIQRQAAQSALVLTDATAAGIREVLALGLTDQLAPVEVARRVGELAGLTARQARAVENFRATVTRRLAPVEEALTPQVQAVIDRQVARYRDRQLLFRGRGIAETETQEAIQAGEHAFWTDAVSRGVVPAEEVFKVWRTVADARVCPICEPLHGQVVLLRESFETPVGPRQRPTLHPRCRCYLEYRHGRGSSPRDRGPGAPERQDLLRELDPESLREDLNAARARVARLERRARTLPYESRVARRLERIRASADSTVQQLAERINAVGGEGGIIDNIGREWAPVGATIRNVRARKIPKGAIAQVVRYEERDIYGYARTGYLTVHDTKMVVRLPDGKEVGISPHSVEILEYPKKKPLE